MTQIDRRPDAAEHALRPAGRRRRARGPRDGPGQRPPPTPVERRRVRADARPRRRARPRARGRPDGRDGDRVARSPPSSSAGTSPAISPCSACPASPREPARAAPSPARVGQFVLAVGRPGGRELMASIGIVSAIGGPVAHARRDARAVHPDRRHAVPRLLGRRADRRARRRARHPDDRPGRGRRPRRAGRPRVAPRRAARPTGVRPARVARDREPAGPHSGGPARGPDARDAGS